MKHNRDRKDVYRVKPVQKIELSKKHLILRLVLFIVFLFLGTGLIAYSISKINKKAPEVVEIKSTYTGFHVGEDFHFYYDLGESDNNPTVENKLLTTLYSDLTNKAYDLFDENSNSVNHNLYYINRHLNEDIIIPALLYNALEKMKNLNELYLYLAPIYEDYYALVNSLNDATADFYNPQNNDNQKEFVQDVLDYINNQDIELILKGNNVIHLKVNDNYFNYLNALEKNNFISFHFFKNAFIIDYFCDNLINENYQYGYIYSNDGYFRNLNNEEYLKYHLYDYDFNQKESLVAGKVHIDKAYALVSFRAFPILSDDNYYQYENGTMVSTLINKLGYSTYQYSNLIGYSANCGCSDIALRLIDYYTTTSLDFNQLLNQNINIIYIQNNYIYYSDQNINIDDLLNTNNKKYEKAPI